MLIWMNRDIDHPERLDGEMWLFNCENKPDTIARYAARWKTLRVGKTAYCDGRVTTGVPLFAQQSEYLEHVNSPN